MGRLDFLDLAEGLGVCEEALFLEVPRRGLFTFELVLGILPPPLDLRGLVAFLLSLSLGLRVGFPITAKRL